MTAFQPFFRGRGYVRLELRSSPFRRGFDHTSIIIQSLSSIHLARKKKFGYCRGTVVLHTQYPARVTTISTMIEDFPLGVDSSEKAMASLPSPNGINGGESKVGGTGPMIVRAKSGELIIDPDGLFLKPGKGQPNFRVISTQRLKTNGVRVVGCFKGTNQDVMQDRTTKHTINLAEDGHTGKKILVLETVPCPVFTNRAIMKKLVNKSEEEMFQQWYLASMMLTRSEMLESGEMQQALRKKKISHL